MTQILLDVPRFADRTEISAWGHPEDLDYLSPSAREARIRRTEKVRKELRVSVLKAVETATPALPMDIDPMPKWKRVTDVVLASLLLVVHAPVMLLVMML